MDNKKIRFGVAGLGGMGDAHARNLLEGKIEGAELTAVADPQTARHEKYPTIETFSDSVRMIESGVIDAVLIATPHRFHVPIGISALESGLHVLVEKPVSVDKAEGQMLLDAHKNPKQLLGAMLNMRVAPNYIKLREMIKGGELGEIRRINWIITTWFRSDAYYASGGWRATWAGEGGGLLLNQCPHNLDLWQWIFGMPKRVRAFCTMGRYHDIEVEDDVNAYFEYENGTTGVFITSSGEAPGSNRLEVVGDNGKIVIEDGSFRFVRNEIPTSEFCRTTKERFKKPPFTVTDIPFSPSSGAHTDIMQNFVNAIHGTETLVAPGEEALHSVEMANAILLSSAFDRTIEFPMDAREYAEWLEKMSKGSRFSPAPVSA